MHCYYAELQCALLVFVSVGASTDRGHTTPGQSGKLSLLSRHRYFFTTCCISFVQVVYGGLHVMA